MRRSARSNGRETGQVTTVAPSVPGLAVQRFGPGALFLPRLCNVFARMEGAGPCVLFYHHPNSGPMTECIFCRIVKKEAEASIIYEDDNALVFLDTQPLANGHALVVPKRHFADIFDIDEAVLERLIQVAKVTAQRMCDVLGIDAVNLINNSGSSAEQSVFHFHIHVIPRKGGDKVGLVSDWWRKKTGAPPRSELNNLAGRLRIRTPSVSTPAGS